MDSRDLVAHVQAESDQIAAALRDLNPGQRLGLIARCMQDLGHIGQALVATGQVQAGSSVLVLSGLADKAGRDLLHSVGEFQHADHVLDLVDECAARLRGGEL